MSAKNNGWGKTEFSFKTYLQSLTWSFKAIRECSPQRGLHLLVSSIIASAIPVLSTVVLGLLVDRFVKVGSSQGGSQGSLFFWLVLAIFLFFAGSLLEEAQKYLRGCLADELSLFLQAKLYRHANRLPLSFFENSRSLDQLFRVRSGSGSSSILGPINSAINGVTGLVQAASLVGLMVWYAPLSGFSLILATGPMALVQWFMVKQRYLLDLQTTKRQRWGSYYTSLLTQPKSLVPVRMFALAEFLRQRFLKTLGEINVKREHLYHKRARLAILAQLFFFFVFAVVMVWMFSRLARGSLTTSGLVIFGLAAFRAQTAIVKVIGSTGKALDSTYVINYLIDFFAIPESSLTAGSTVKEEVAEAVAIRFENVSFAYENTDKQVLENVSFEIQKGQKIAIVGTNGAGKSTLIKLLCRLYALSEGRILLGGSDIAKLDFAAINSQIAIVTQDPIRFEGSVKENIAYGNWERYKNDDAAVEKILEKAHLNDFSASLPQGIHTLIGRQFGDYTMSGGQWQRLAIARVLTRPTPVLILDEPTSSLDALSEQAIFRMLCEEAEERTVIFVTHRFSTVKMVDRIIVLEDGRLVEDGTHAELMRNKGIYTSMYKAYQGR